MAVTKLEPVVRLVQRALPHLNYADVCWRLHFTFGIEHMTHWDNARLAIRPGGACDGNSAEESIERARDQHKLGLSAPGRVSTGHERRKHAQRWHVATAAPMS